MRNAGTYTHISYARTDFPLHTHIHTCTNGMNTYARTTYVCDASYSKSSKQDCEQNANEICAGIKSEITKSEGVQQGEHCVRVEPGLAGAVGSGLVGPFPGVWNGFRLAAVTISGYLNCRTWAAINYKNDGTAQPNRRKSCLLRLFRIVQPSQAKAGQVGRRPGDR